MKTKTDRELNTIPKALDHLLYLILGKVTMKMIEAFMDGLIAISLFTIFYYVYYKAIQTSIGVSI